MRSSSESFPQDHTDCVCTSVSVCVLMMFTGNSSSTVQQEVKSGCEQASKPQKVKSDIRQVMENRLRQVETGETDEKTGELQRGVSSCVGKSQVGLLQGR